MTSLIDVIFLLLLFFMLSSTFSKFSEIPLLGAQAGTSASTPANAAPLFVRLFEDRLQLNGQEFDLSTLPDGINRLRGEGAQTVLIAPQRNQATAQRLVDTLVVLSTVPDLTVIVLE